MLLQLDDSVEKRVVSTEGWMSLVQFGNELSTYKFGFAQRPVQNISFRERSLC